MKRACATLLVLAFSVSVMAQSKRRQEQIEDLLKKSDLVVVATAQATYPVIDIEKYRVERDERNVNDPRRRSRYTTGTAYKLMVKEALYQKPAKDSNQPRRDFHVDDAVMIYVPGPPAQPLQETVASFSGTEYVVFLKRKELDPDDFPRGIQQDLNAPMRDWQSFPNPVETYFSVIRDPLAVKIVDDVWIKFVDHTREVARTMSTKQ
jgi:hypothetical protein